MTEVAINQDEKYVDIHPLKKGKRALVFLADFFIHFILSFLIFIIAVAPIGKAMTNFEDKNDEHIVLTSEMYEHYYKSNVLLKDGSFDKLDVTAGVEYTYRCFLSYFVIESEESVDTNHAQYGHKNENNVIYHYYAEIRNNEQNYIDLFKNYNSQDNYFDFHESTKTFSLKNEVKNELYAFYDPKDDMGTIGKKYYSNIQEHVFNPMLAEVMRDIETNDLHYEGEKHSFVECKTRIKDIETYHENLMTICAVISHTIIWSILFVIIPLINRNRKTLAMMFMKIERVNFYSLNLIKRNVVVVASIYYFFAMMIGMMFIPSMLVPFNNLFSLRFLMYATVFSSVLSLGGLIFLMANQYNRSLIDYLSNTLYLTSDEMDEVYRARGYTI